MKQNQVATSQEKKNKNPLREAENNKKSIHARTNEGLQNSTILIKIIYISF